MNESKRQEYYSLEDIRLCTEIVRLISLCPLGTILGPFWPGLLGRGHWRSRPSANKVLFSYRCKVSKMIQLGTDPFCIILEK